MDTRLNKISSLKYEKFIIEPPGSSEILTNREIDLSKLFSLDKHFLFHLDFRGNLTFSFENLKMRFIGRLTQYVTTKNIYSGQTRKIVNQLAL